MNNNKSDYQGLLNDFDEEIAFNNKIYNASKGFPLNFGDTIQFEHLKSHKFLSYQPDQTAGSFNVLDTFT